MSEENQDRSRKWGRHATDDDKGTSPDVEAHRKAEDDPELESEDVEAHRKVDDEPEVESPDVEAHRHQGRGRHSDR